MLTATLVTILPDGKTHCKCVNRAAGRVLEFNLSEPDATSGEIEYTPTRLQLGTVEVPDWMKEECVRGARM